MKKKSPLILFILIACLAAGMAGRAQAGSVQFSTYYPAPFGMYDRLRLVPRGSLGFTCVAATEAGTLYVDNGTNQVMLCDAAGNWVPLLASGFWTQSGSNLYVTNTSLNVGIGTATPSEKLHVYAPSGSAMILAQRAAAANGWSAIGLLGSNQNWYMYIPTNSNILSFGNDVTSFMQLTPTGDVGIGVVMTPGSKLEVKGSTADNTASALNATNSAATSLLYVRNDGNVGIGTTTPQNKLDVEGAGVIGATYSGTNAAPANGLLVEGNVGIGTTTPGFSRLYVSGGPLTLDNNLYVNLGNAASPSLSFESDPDTGIFRGTAASNILSFSTGGTERMRINEAGNVGIGTTTPASRLEVKGSTTDNTASALNATNSANTSLLYVRNDGRVGIGTTTPGSKLHVLSSVINPMGVNEAAIEGAHIGSGIAGSGGAVGVSGGANGPGAQSNIGGLFGAWNSTNSNVGLMIFLPNTTGGGDFAILSTALAKSVFYGPVGIGGNFTPVNKLDVEGAAVIGATYSGTNAAPANGLLVEGSVGIGEPIPSAKLHVNGNIKAILNTIGGNSMVYNPGSDEIGYDVAELFETSEEVETGDLLIIDEDTKRKLKKSHAPYDPKAAGIVSQSPAIVFEGRELQIAPAPGGFTKGKKPPVTLAGRVLCKVTTENGIIRPGDLLTSSSAAGHAMKATDREKSFGAIVGKALESFDGGPNGETTGMITVLATLQ